MTYKYFISSHYAQLKKEREEAKNAILDLGCTPIAMEHFAINQNDGFSDIKRLIDVSDIFLLLIGNEYGSTEREFDLDSTSPDADKSWTEREFEYAKKQKKKICAIKLPSYVELEKREKKNAPLNDKEQKQLSFGKTVGFAGVADEEYSIYRRICLYHSTRSLIDDVSASVQWKKDNKRFALSGKWYSVHTSDRDPNYLRIGTVEFVQDFCRENYRDIVARAKNYDVCVVDGKVQCYESGLIKENRNRTTSWSADYELYPGSKEDKIIGVYISTRSFQSTFEDAITGSADRQYGVHEYVLNDSELSAEGETYMHLKGFFRDAADPKSKKKKNHKAGNIDLFRYQRDRDSFVLEHFEKHNQQKAK